MPAQARIHLFFGARCLEMDSGLRRNDVVDLAILEAFTLFLLRREPPVNGDIY
jgi:hypothetical protein